MDILKKLIDMDLVIFEGITEYSSGVIREGKALPQVLIININGDRSED